MQTLYLFRAHLGPAFPFHGSGTTDDRWAESWPDYAFASYVLG